MSDVAPPDAFAHTADAVVDRPPALTPAQRELERIWSTPPGWGRLSAVNHTVLGRRFMVAAFVFFAIGGALAMLIRAQLASPRSAFLGPDLYNQIFTMHGTVMMFLFAIPMFEGVAIYLLPKMLGARDFAFPRLTALGFWCYVFGGGILIAALLAGAAPDGGWFMYTPLSSSTHSPGINADVWLLGVTFVEVSAMAAAVELVVSILRFRAPGMTLARMPLFGWYILVTAGMMLVGFPPLILGSILLEVERAFDLPFFDPTRGGDPLLWQHLFWLFGHPEVYIIFLPAAGIVSTILPVLVGRPLIGYSWVVVSVAATGFLSFGLWVHHMFAVGIPHLAQAFFSAASILVAVPTGVQIFLWLGTMLAGRPRMSVPMLYLFGFFSVFVCGGLTGVMVAVVPFDWQVHDTHFVVAHLHYVLVGGFVFPMLAAAYYYLPHVTGRQPVYAVGVLAFWLIFVGFNLTFFVMHLTGLLGMPRRWAYVPEGLGWEWPNLVSSIGGFVTTAGFALFAVDMLFQFRFGRPSPPDPWSAETLEWATATPPRPYAFAALPEVAGRAPLKDDPGLRERLDRGEGFLAVPRNGWQETLVVDAATAQPLHIAVLPRPSFLPLWSALAIGGFVLSLLFKLYWFSPVAILLVTASFLAWGPSSGHRRSFGALDAGRGLSLKVHAEVERPPTWWGLMLLLVANATLFASLLFGALFLWLTAPLWPALLDVSLPLPKRAALVIAAAAAAILAHLALARARRTGPDAAVPMLAGAALAQVLAAALGVWLLAVHVPDPTRHAYPALVFAFLAYLVLHAAIGAVLAGFGIWRCRAGFVARDRLGDLAIGTLWHDYTAAATLIAVLFLAALEALIPFGALMVQP
ncbi:cytochrome c oxidase subunit I [Aureimonas pseudogalii]|uniref:cytochrome-c oxidase n=1 Tax=Aureimonas pseudogalii TaxID=1744844 RepID=A0A7W6E9N8_9HYPH|nr:cytochrome c oxidase subunit I [Aureimonas pseudogalii]MBB3997297.1 cytochrome c oxidase subunit I+III [Aureimonas pseudogalii]